MSKTVAALVLTMIITNLLVVGVLIKKDVEVTNKKSEVINLKTENAAVKLAIRQAFELYNVKGGRIGLWDYLKDNQTFGVYVSYDPAHKDWETQSIAVTFSVEGHKLLREVARVGVRGSKRSYDGEGEDFSIIDQIK